MFTNYHCAVVEVLLNTFQGVCVSVPLTTSSKADVKSVYICPNGQYCYYIV